MILPFPMKRLAIITPVCVVYRQIFSEHAKFSLVLHQRSEPLESNFCFSILYRLKNCRCSVHDRSRDLQIIPEVTEWNVFHYFYIHSVGISKSTTISWKLSNRYAAIWYESARTLKWWLIWLTLRIVPWSYCHIWMNAVLITIIKSCKNSSLH